MGVWPRLVCVVTGEGRVIDGLLPWPGSRMPTVCPWPSMHFSHLGVARRFDARMLGSKSARLLARARAMSSGRVASATTERTVP